MSETEPSAQPHTAELIAAVQGELMAALKRAEALRAEAEEARAGLELANRQKDEFLAMLAHELRNPLGPILNAAELLRGRTTSDPVALRASEILVRQAHQLTRVVDDLLDAARVSRGKLEVRPESVDLVALLRQLADDVRSGFEARQIAFGIELPDTPTTIVGDPVRLTQAIGNILSNAAKFTRPGGSVRLTLDVARDGRDGPAARITVSDTGIGMHESFVAHVFEPFTQRVGEEGRSGGGGLGLGMAIARGVVELHGGRIAASSDGEGHGSRFTIHLPLPSPADTMPAHPPARQPRDDEPRRIVVIDDNIDAAEVMQAMLESVGHVVAVAHDGREGLSLIRSFDPEVVLCDLDLPGSTNGLDVARALRSEDQRRRLLIAVTGYGRAQDREAALGAGFDTHATKPVDLDQLHRLVAGDLDAPSV